MSAVGFASIPISISARGVMADLEKQIGQPMHKVAQKAATDMERAIVDGAKRTANEVEKARQAEVRAARDVEAAEKKILEAKEKTRQQTVKVETAEKQLEIVRSAQGRKVADMEAAIEKARKDGKTSVEDLTRKEELLREARLKADVAVTSKEESLQKAYRDSEKAARDVESAEKDRQKALSKAKDAADNVIAATKRYDTAAEQASSRTAKWADELRQMDSPFGGVIGKVSKLSGLVAGFLGVKSIGDSLMAGFEKTMAIEDTTASLGILMGSAERADSVMQALQETNQGTPYSFDSWAAAGKNLIAFGVDAEYASRVVVGLGEAASASGKGEDALNSMASAFGTAAASGKISMDTINRLADGGVQGLAILANEFDVSTEEMQKMISKGAVPAQEGIRILTEGIIEGSSGAAGEVNALSGTMQSMAETIRGRMTNMGSAFNNAGAAVIQHFVPAISTGIDMLSDGAKKVRDFFNAVAEGGPEADRLKAVLLGVGTAVAGLAGGMVAVAAAQKVLAFQAMAKEAGMLQAVLARLNLTFMASPVFWIGAAIAAATAGLALFFTKTEMGQQIWADLSESLSAAWEGLIERVKPALDLVSAAWSELTAAFRGGDDGYGALASMIGVEKAEWVVNVLANVKTAWSELKAALMGGDDGYGALAEIIGMENAELVMNTVAAVGDALRQMWGSLKDLSGVLVELGKNLLGSVLGSFQALAKSVMSLVGVLVPVLLPVVQNIAKVVGGVLIGAFFAAVKVIETVAKVMTFLIDKAVIPLVNWLGGKLPSVLGIVVPAVAGVGSAFQGLGKVAKVVYEKVIAPVLEGMGDAAEVMLKVVAVGVLVPLQLAWEVLSAGISLAWEGTIKPTWDAMGAAAVWLWEVVIRPVTDAINAAVTLMGGVIQSVWDMVIRPVWDAMGGALRALAEVVIRPTLQWVGDLFSDLGSVIKVVIDWVTGELFGRFKTGLDTLQGWVEVAASAIGQVWDGLRALFAEPINFIIRTVYTDGIKPVFDGVAEKVGLDSRLPDVQEIGGYADGGVLPGYTPGRDPYRFIEPRHGLSIGLSGGEAILRPEATRALGEDWVNRVNAAARTGGVPAVEQRLRNSHFADGGIVSIGDFAAGGFINLAGALSEIQKSHAAFVARFFPGSFALTSASRAEPGSMHDFSRAAATDWQAQDGQYASQMPTPMSKALSRAIYTNFPSTAQLIHHPLDGWENLLNGGPHDYGPATNAQHRNHVHWGTNSALRFDGDDIVLDDVPGAGRFSFDPASWFSALWERITGPLPSFGGPGDLGRVPGEALSTMGGWVKDWALGTLREWAEKFMNFVGLGGGGAQQWADQAAEALRRMGYGEEHLGAMLRQIEIESSGDPTAVNTWDSNYLRGTPSGGLLQVIDPTYQDVRRRYPGAFEGLPDDRFHPLTNLTAGVAAVTRDWGGPAGRWPTTAGYAHGGLAGPGQGMLLKTAMEPEYVLNPAMTQAFIDWMRAGSGGDVPIVRLEAPAWEGFAAHVDEATLAALDLGRSLEGPFLDSTAEVKKALEELDAAREKAAQGTDKVSEAEKALADAQKELEDALNGTSETSTSTARKIEDAEAALAKAREESSGTSVSASRKIIDAEKALAKAREDGKADKIAAAEERLARAREDQSTSAAKSAEKSAEKIAEAEKRLARAREDEAEAAAKAEEKRAQSVEKAEEKISKAEKNLEKVRRESVTAADEVVAAEKRVATARLQAAGRIITDIGGAVTGIVGHFARLTATMADLARQAEATEDALAAQRVEAAMAELQRLKALANFAQAEKDLEHARVSGAEMTRLIGDTSVSAMGLALERFRKDGVFAVEMVSVAATTGAQQVNAVQGDVHAERMAAVQNLKLAAVDYAEASLQASHAAEIQKILGYQLLAQQQAIYGVSSMQYDALTQFIMGIVKIISGVVKIGAGIAAAIAAVSAGPAGWIALPGIITAAISGATDIGQGWTMVQDNKDEAREAWDAMDNEGRFNAVATGLGAAAPAVVGGIGFGMTGDAQILVETAKAMEAATKTMVDHTEFLVKRQMDQATVPYEEQIAEATKRHEAELSELRLVREGLITAYESGSDEIAEAVERLLDSVLGESIKPEATDLVVEARSAAEQRNELVAETRRIADRPVEKQPVVVNVTGSGLTVAEVQEVFDYVNGRVDGLQLQVNQIGQQNAVATVAAQR